MQSYPSGGALFTLTALTEVAVLPIQLFLLQGGGYTARHFQIVLFHFGTKNYSLLDM